MRELDRIRSTRIVASPAALDSAVWPADALVWRTAPDEVVVTAADGNIAGDPHAIVEPDESLAGLWLTADEAGEMLERGCEWELPDGRPVLAQGAIFGIPAKLWLERDRVLVLVPAPYAAEFAERMA